MPTRTIRQNERLAFTKCRRLTQLTDAVERSGIAFGRAAGSGKMPRSIPDAQGTTPVSLLRAFASWRLRDQTQRRRGAKTQRTDQGASELAKLLLAPNSFRDFQSPRTSRLSEPAHYGMRIEKRRTRGLRWSRLVRPRNDSCLQRGSNHGKHGNTRKPEKESCIPSSAMFEHLSPETSFRVFPCVPWFKIRGSRTLWPNFY